MFALSPSHVSTFDVDFAGRRSRSIKIKEGDTFSFNENPRSNSNFDEKMLGQKELVCFCVNGGRLFNDGDPQIGRRAEIEQKYISCFVLWREILDQLEWERPGSSDEEICSFDRKVAEFFDIWTPMHGEKGKFLRLSCSHVHWHVLFFIAPS